MKFLALAACSGLFLGSKNRLSPSNMKRPVYGIWYRTTLKAVTVTLWPLSLSISSINCQMTYYLWMFHFGVLFMNVLGGLSYFIAEGLGTVFGLGILYLILFTPCSFICWYRPLYKVGTPICVYELAGSFFWLLDKFFINHVNVLSFKAFRNDSSFNFMLFFFVFAVQSVASVIQVR